MMTTVNQLIRRLELEIINLADGEREVSDGYTGDLLSWVMGRAGVDCAWVTIMSNQNVAAVALLADAACVILAENVSADEALLEKAKDQGVNLLKSDKGAYEICWKLHEAIG